MAIFTCPVPPGSVGLALKGGKVPIVIDIDRSSPLHNTPIEPGFVLVAVKLGNGITLEDMDTKETIDALKENNRDPNRRLVFISKLERDDDESDKELEDKHSLEYWETDLVGWFKYYDMDGSGSLSQKEVIDAMVDTFGVPQNRKKITDVVKKFWRRNDFDSDGYIKLYEFCSPDGFGKIIRKVIHGHLLKDIPDKPSLKYWENNIMKWFHYYDVDASGHMTQNEIIDGLVDTFSVPQRREKIAAFVEKYWAKNDFDQNGMISLDEFCDEHGFGNKLRKVIQSAIEKRSKKELKTKPTLEYWEKNISEWFDFYDQDHNGFLSQQEVIDGFIETFDVPQNRAKVTDVTKTYWDRNDFDRDGYISKEEFCDEKGYGWKLKTVIEEKIKKIKKQKKNEDTKKEKHVHFSQDVWKEDVWKEDVGAWFEFYDTDGSKTLSKAEVIAALIETFSVKNPEKKKSIKSTVIDIWFLFDLDANQVVNKDEFLFPGGLAETLQAQLEGGNNKSSPAKKKAPAYTYDERSNSIKVPVPAGDLGIALKRGDYPILLQVSEDSPLYEVPVEPGFALAGVQLGNGVTYSKMNTDMCVQLLQDSIEDPGRELIFQAGPYVKIGWT